MDPAETLALLEMTGALCEGHWKDRMGRHHLRQFRICKALQFAPYNRKLCFEIVRHFLELDIHVIIAPTVGSIPVAVEVGRQLEARVIFLDPLSGVPELYRGLELHEGERVIVTADLIRRDEDIDDVSALIRSSGARLVGIGTIVDARQSIRRHTVKDVSAVRVPDVDYSSEDCPLCSSSVTLLPS